MTAMTAKQALRDRIDELSEQIDTISEEEAAEMLWRLDDALQPVPEPLTPDEIAHLREGIGQLDAGRGIPHEEVLRRFGINR
jgi:predicted transcriptional regulator